MFPFFALSLMKVPKSSLLTTVFLNVGGKFEKADVWELHHHIERIQRVSPSIIPCRSCCSLKGRLLGKFSLR